MKKMFDVKVEMPTLEEIVKKEVIGQKVQVKCPKCNFPNTVNIGQSSIVCPNCKETITVEYD